MRDTLQFLIRHGYTVLFVWVLAEQLGLPIPAIPLLLAAGALAGSGNLNVAFVLLVALTAALAGDTLWYEIGRRRGSKVLNFLCRISLEPDSCVRKTENMFARQGGRALIFAKFVPGLSVMAPPLAGIFKMRFWRFLLYDGLGSLLWAGGFVAVGYAFSNQLEAVADRALQLGSTLVVLVVGGLAGYILWKFAQRQKFMRDLRIARITADELKQKLDSGEEVLIVDLRHSVDFDGDPMVIPGAHHLDAEELEQHHDAIPRDRDIILYCT